MCVFSVSGERAIRIEPSYNPFWVQVGTPFSITCIKEAAASIPVVWTVKGGAPEDAGYKTKDTTVSLANGQVRTSSLLTKDNVGLEDIGPAGLLCETDEPEDEREELFIGVNLFNGSYYRGMCFRSSDEVSVLGRSRQQFGGRDAVRWTVLSQFAQRPCNVPSLRLIVMRMKEKESEEKDDDDEGGGGGGIR